MQQGNKALAEYIGFFFQAMSDSDEQDEFRREVALRLEKQVKVTSLSDEEEPGTSTTPPTSTTNSRTTATSVSTFRNDSGCLISVDETEESRQHAGGREATSGATGDAVEGEMLWSEVQRVRRKLRDVEQNCFPFNEGANSSSTIALQLDETGGEAPRHPVRPIEAVRASSVAVEGETLWNEIQRVRRKLLRSFQTTEESSNSSTISSRLRQGETTIPTADDIGSAYGTSHVGDRTLAPRGANLGSPTLESSSVQVERPGIEPGAYRVRPQGRIRRQTRRGSRRIDAARDEDSDSEGDGDDDEGDDGGVSVPERSTEHSQSVATGSTLPYDAGPVVAVPIYEEDFKPSIVAQATPLRRKVRKLACTLLIVVLTVIGIAVAIALTTQSNNSGGGSEGPTSAPTSAIPLNMSVLLGQFFDGLPAVTAAAVTMENSPQSRAFQWLDTSIQLNSTFFQQESEKSILSRMTQRFALATLYFATSGRTEWTNSTNWLSASVDECTWSGCMCSSGPGLLSLILPGNELDGTVPLEVSLLAPSLTLLNLGSNTLKGPLPSQLGSMSTLQQLYLGSTELNGSIPTSFGLMTALIHLDLSQNALKGAIPTTLGNLPSLSTLRLNDNSLTGKVPSELGLATSLKTLQVSGNNLSGVFPSEICALDGLVPDVDCLELTTCDCCGC